MAQIRCRLSTILGCRRISQRKFSRMTGLSTTTINKLFNEKWNRIDKKTLAKICETRNISVEDLLVYSTED